MELDTGYYYVCRGDIRGECGHRHRSRAAALRCQAADAAGCRAQGGYSDRVLVVVSRDDGAEWEDVGETPYDREI